MALARLPLSPNRLPRMVTTSLLPPAAAERSSVTRRAILRVDLPVRRTRTYPLSVLYPVFRGAGKCAAPDRRNDELRRQRWLRNMHRYRCTGVRIGIADLIQHGLKVPVHTRIFDRRVSARHEVLARHVGAGTPDGFQHQDRRTRRILSAAQGIRQGVTLPNQRNEFVNRRFHLRQNFRKHMLLHVHGNSPMREPFPHGLRIDIDQGAR